MAFLESPRFPEGISYGVMGGPEFSTTVITVNSGFEQRNSNWSAPRGSWDASHSARSESETKELIAFFRAVGGMRDGFRFRDWSDYKTGADGVLSAVPDDADQFTLYKKYAIGGRTEYRRINKPVPGTVTITGGGAYTVDYATGIVTRTSGSAPTKWTGEFDIPCRFGTDKLELSIIAHGVYSWQSIPIIEIRQ